MPSPCADHWNPPTLSSELGIPELDGRIPAPADTMPIPTPAAITSAAMLYTVLFFISLRQIDAWVGVVQEKSSYEYRFELWYP